ncbi:MAG: hypothetical protein KF700_00930 [Hyphomonadaceae bacterium]|nr:hypothetical protein [Hyphomonadaceae bacterium]
MTAVLVAGVGMVKFAKPGASEPYPQMTASAIRAALADSNLRLEDVGMAAAGFCYGGSGCGQRSLYEVGMTGMPVFNVSNACSTGSSAIYLARQAVESGATDVALAFGFEEMRPGALAVDTSRVLPVDHFFARFGELDVHIDPAMAAPIMFGAAGARYLERYGASAEIFADVAVKTRAHAARNPMSLFSKPLTREEVMGAPLLWGTYLTRLMACPPTCGAAAAILVSRDFARKRGLSGLVEIAGQAMTTDTRASYVDEMNLVGRDMSRRAAAAAYEAAGIGPEDVSVAELHDCFTPNEVISYEALGLCGEGEASKMIAEGDNTFGGRVVVNPSGGLMSKGHPLGATGLAQCYELVMQLRGRADARQVADARAALQHNIGLGGAAVVTIYKAA